MGLSGREWDDDGEIMRPLGDQLKIYLYQCF